MFELHEGDCLEYMKEMDAESVDSIVTDPPYGLKFMDKDWDYGIPGVAYWKEALRVAKPGAYLLAFGGTRTFHRLMCAIEDAGWEVRDTVGWIYGQGFPKGHNVAWELHKKACTLCGIMVKYDHEETQSNTPGIEGSSSGTAGEIPSTEYDLRFVRGTYLQTPVYACAKCGQVLQPFMSKQESQELRTAWEKSEIIWPEQSSVEGWSDLETTQRKLQRCEVCQMSSGVFADGAEGWLYYGASVSDGSIPWQVANADGSCPSYRPQSSEQLHRQSDAIRVERQAQTYRGYNVALKPAWEPVIVARKPLIGTVAENVLQYGTGAMNIDASRVRTGSGDDYGRSNARSDGAVNKGEFFNGLESGEGLNEYASPAGRWPANLIHDGSDEVMELFPQTKQASARPNSRGVVYDKDGAHVYGKYAPNKHNSMHFDTGSAARFFYCAKASKADRDEGLEDFFWWKETSKSHWQRIDEPEYRRMKDENDEAQKQKRKSPHIIAMGNVHETVKPESLMRYLCKLVTPPGGIVFDPFMGSGSTGKAAIKEGFRFFGCDTDPDYVQIAEMRIKCASEKDNSMQLSLELLNLEL